MKVRVNLTIEPDTKAKMESLAQGTHLSQGEVVDNAVRLYASSLPPSRGGTGRMNFQKCRWGQYSLPKTEVMASSASTFARSLTQKL